jgi:hypothetical protein
MLKLLSRIAHPTKIKELMDLLKKMKNFLPD